MKFKSELGYKDKEKIKSKRIDRRITIETNESEAISNPEQWMLTRFVATNELKIHGNTIEKKLLEYVGKDKFDAMLNGTLNPDLQLDGNNPLGRFFFGYAFKLLFRGWITFLPSYNGPKPNRWEYSLNEIATRTVYPRYKRQPIIKFDKWYYEEYLKNNRIGEFNTKILPKSSSLYGLWGNNKK